MMRVVGPELHREQECERVLRSVPEWFGIEAATQTYIRDTGTMPTFGLETEEGIMGFVTLREHFPASWEMHCLAVHASLRNQGHGTRLVEHAEHWLRSRGALFLQVKTLAATVDDPNYAQTRIFYGQRGYVPLEIFPTLWGPENHCLQLIKVLQTG